MWTKLLVAVAIVGAMLASAPTLAQTPAGAGAERSEGPARLASDLKAYVTAPLHAKRRQWVRFGAVVGATVAAYQYDESVHEHFGATSPQASRADTYDAQDAAPAALMLAGTWFSAALLDDDDGRREARSMLEATAFSSAVAYMLKKAAGRERPSISEDPNDWQSGGDSFPSLHTTAAFAIGTVFAESGNDRYRWIRRVLGYGIAAGTAYRRLDHNVHWFSDTVAGAGLGVATARFVMKRNERSAERAEIRLEPSNGGFALTYTVALQ